MKWSGWSVQRAPDYPKRFNRFFPRCYTLKRRGIDAETLRAGWDDKTGSRKRYAPEDRRDALLDELWVKDLAAPEREWLEFVQAVPIEAPEALYQRGYNAAVYGEGSPEQALADLAAALAAGLDEPRVHYAHGLAQALAGDWDAAIADLREAIARDPLDATYRAELAWLLCGGYGEGDELVGTPDELEEAAVQYDLAAALDPQNDELATLAARYRELRGE